MKKHLLLKTIAMLSTLAMIVSLFASCNKNSGDNTPSAETTAATEAQTEPATKTVELSDVVIIHANDEVSTSAATTLQTLIKDKTSVTVSISNTYESSDSYKILIGNFGLDITADFFAKSEEERYKNYEVIFSGNIIAIAATNEITAESACAALVEKCLKRAVKTMDFSNDFSFAGDFYGHEAIGFNSRVDQTDIRIVSFNIAYYMDIKPRVAGLMELVDLFDADVIMFQECSDLWHHNIDDLLSQKGYKIAPINRQDKLDVDNWNPIYYRESTIELLSSSHASFTVAPADPQKDASTYTTADFKVKSSGKAFTAICSHFSTDATAREKNGAELAGIIKDYQKTKNNPIFLLGDLNSTTGQKPLTSSLFFMTNAMNMKNIVKKNFNYGTTNTGSGNWPEPNGPIIDHAYAYGSGYTGKQIQIVPSALAAATSDHLPIIFDFALN